MMKILHTSDWHIGQQLYNYDRSDEHQAFFDILNDIVRNEMPDALVVSGDIFHTAAPSASAQRLYVDNMLRIHETAPQMTVAVTAGNHDSSSRMEIDRTLWEHFGVHTVGSIRNSRIIPVGSPAKGYIVAVPHCFPQNFPSEDDTPREMKASAFYRSILAETVRINTEGLPVVLMAHTTVTGSDPRRQDIIVGGLDSVNITELGDGFDYLALGHIHYPQNISPNARYCGSPIPVSFNEDYPHSVTIAELGPHGTLPTIRTIGIPVLRPVITIPEQAADFDEALGLLKEFPDDKEAYIRLHVKVRKYGGADWAERTAAATEGKMCRYCCMSVETEGEGASDDGRTNFSREEMRKMKPAEIARIYWRETKGYEMDEKLVRMMEDVENEIREDEGYEA